MSTIMISGQAPLTSARKSYGGELFIRGEVMEAKVEPNFVVDATRLRL
jgi:hypothetical protein